MRNELGAINVLRRIYCAEGLYPGALEEIGEILDEQNRINGVEALRKSIYPSKDTERRDRSSEGHGPYCTCTYCQSLDT